MGTTFDETTTSTSTSSAQLIELASEIDLYLPRDLGVLSNYTRHIWGAFEAIVEKGEPSRGFAILPFHLLFMFAIQCKVYRLSAYNKPAYLEILDRCNLRNPGYKRVLKENPPIPDSSGNVPSTSSVRNLSLLPEKQLFDFLSTLEISNAILDKAKRTVKIRNTYTHANGNIEENLEERIEEYLDILRNTQPNFRALNDAVAVKWLAEIEPGEAGIEYIELHLAEEYLCPADMQQGKLAELDKRLNGEN